MAPRKTSEDRRKSGRSSIPDEEMTEEYRKKRDKNNLAVKRSRDKTKQKTRLTLDRVMQLKSENETLEEKIRLLTKELGFLKDLFLAHASNNNGKPLAGVDLEAILAENQETSSIAIWKLMTDPTFKISR